MQDNSRANYICHFNGTKIGLCIDNAQSQLVQKVYYPTVVRKVETFRNTNMSIFRDGQKYSIIDRQDHIITSCKVRGSNEFLHFQKLFNYLTRLEQVAIEKEAFVFFHSGCLLLEHRKQVLFIFGPADAGKTTLCLGLAEDGWNWISGELTVLQKDFSILFEFKKPKVAFESLKMLEIPWNRIEAVPLPSYKKEKHPKYFFVQPKRVYHEILCTPYQYAFIYIRYNPGLKDKMKITIPNKNKFLFTVFSQTANLSQLKGKNLLKWVKFIRGGMGFFIEYGGNIEEVKQWLSSTKVFHYNENELQPQAAS